MIIDNFESLTTEQKELVKIQMPLVLKEIETNTFQQTSNFFEENHYVVYKNFINPELAEYFYTYIKMSAMRCAYIDEIKGEDRYYYELWGNFYDTQAPGDYSKYGDMTFDSLLALKHSLAEKITGKKLHCNYTYHRLYTKGTELKRHKDRPSCEISATLCIGYDVSNLNSNYNWPMFVGPNTGEKNTEGLPIALNPGDIIFYRGCNLEHWREPLEGLNHAQVFLHYNEVDGEFKNIEKYDGRPMLGMPLNSNVYLNDIKNKL